MKEELRVIIIKTDRSTRLLYILGMCNAELILSKKKKHHTSNVRNSNLFALENQINP